MTFVQLNEQFEVEAERVDELGMHMVGLFLSQERAAEYVQALIDEDIPAHETTPVIFPRQSEERGNIRVIVRPAIWS